MAVIFIVVYRLAHDRLVSGLHANKTQKQHNAVGARLVNKQRGLGRSDCAGATTPHAHRHTRVNEHTYPWLDTTNEMQIF